MRRLVFKPQKKEYQITKNNTMSTRHTTFKDLTLVEFEAYAKTLLDHTSVGVNRERQIAYLRRIVANDDGLIKSDQVLLSARRRLQRLQRAAIDTIESDHSLDFEAAPELFVDAPKTDAEIIALLTQDNSTVSCETARSPAIFALRETTCA
jgi:hypothetical protein